MKKIILTFVFTILFANTVFAAAPLDDPEIKDLVMQGLQDVFAENIASMQADYHNIDDMTLEELQELLVKVQNKIEELTKTDEDSSEIILTVGESIITDDFELEITNIDFKEAVYPTNENIWLYYNSDEGEQYLDVEGIYLNKAKETTYPNKMISAIADYNNGYIYKGFVVSDTESDGLSTYASCLPLASCVYHCLITVPDIVAESTEALFITFELDNGTVYRYDIR